MNNNLSNNFKHYNHFTSNVPKAESTEAKKKRSSFYDDYREKVNQLKKQAEISTSSPALNLPNLTPKKSQPVLQNPVSTGSVIKKNIEGVLSEKYGELDTRNLFDGIEDKDIEDNIETAERTIKTNIDRGALSEKYFQKFPNLRDGLALSYAAANKGKSKAATRARDAAYSENEEPLVKDTGIKLFSTEPPKIESTQKTPKKKEDFSNLLANPNEKPKMTKLLLKSNETPNLADELKMMSTRVVPEGSHGIRFKAEMQNLKTENNQENKFDYSDKKSSTLDKYELPDAVKDWFSVTDGGQDLWENLFKNDHVSAIIDIIRMNNPKAEFGKDAARAVWKAGSEFYLRPRNLNISADMLEHSLQENPKDVVFYEDSDVVKQIKNNSGFITHLDDVVYKVENNIPLSEKDKSYGFNSDDLFYSIHNCSFDIENIKYNEDGTKDIAVHLHDTYDYTEILTFMDEKKYTPLNFSLGSFANDMGTITSQMDALNPYEIDIYFTIRR